MNAQIGTHFPVDSNWQDIFNEEASLPIGSEATVNNEADWPSDDSKDDDYDPEMRENGGGNSSNVSGDGGGDNDEESISTSLSLSSDGVALSTGSWEGHRLSNMVEQCETSNEETVCGPRQRRTVDYTQLYYEMFGKDAVLQEQGSEDEDWGPNDRRKRKRESDAGSTLVTMCESSKKDQDVVETLEQSERDSVSVENKGGRRRMFRLPRNAVEKLRQVFAETELPSKAVRDRLAKELSLDPEKVNKWFKNTRYMALRNRKTESVKQPGDSKTVSGGDSGPEAVMENNTETNEVQDTLDDTVPPGFDATNQNILSPCNNNQEEFQQENVSFPSPTDESQQYLEQNDSSFVLVPHEKQSSEISLKTAVEENETESKMMKEPHEELSSEMSLKTAAEEKETESKMIEEPHEELSREMSLKTAVEEKETESKMMEEPHDELNSEMSLSTAVEEKETGSKMTEEVK
jgi:hypothetical protein